MVIAVIVSFYNIFYTDFSIFNRNKIYRGVSQWMGQRFDLDYLSENKSIKALLESTPVTML